MLADAGKRAKRLETEAIVIGYAMSRLDRAFLSSFEVRSWKSAFSLAAKAIGVRESSLKNLRDEFDPIHNNLRKGWWDRSIRTSRQRVALELGEVSDDALLELVRKIINRDNEATDVAIDALTPENNVASAVAERLLTGRRAEEYFLKNSYEIVGVKSENLVDYRINASGFDFAINSSDGRVFEIKGIKDKKGDILFTDREWLEAERRSKNYILVVIGQLKSTPVSKVIIDPRNTLKVTCVWQQTISASWRSTVAMTL